MCGIFGLVSPHGSALQPPEAAQALKDLALISLARGKESSGVALTNGREIQVLKRPISARRLVKSQEYKELLDHYLWPGDDAPRDQLFAAMGHARLVTNGLAGINANNQPAIKDGVVGVHNGIVVNAPELWARNPELTRATDLDTEVMLSLLRLHLNQTGSLAAALQQTYQEIYGTASVALFFDDLPVLTLASNFGSLYFARNQAKSLLVFASQRDFLEQFFKKRQGPLWDMEPVVQVVPRTAHIIDLASLAIESVQLDDTETPTAKPARSTESKVRIVDVAGRAEERIQELRRCTRCILPETMPFIRFDEDGVCNYCHNYQPINPRGREALLEMVEPFRSKDGRPDCLVPFSGGRDSSYALHYIKRELGLNPVAYTYDWALVTDLARRNQSRLCDRLGIEHYLVSADIKRKRAFIRKNVQAWLKRPALGMIPLFMAGDKFYFYYASKIREITGIELVLFGGNRLEKTGFKTGFCGVPDQGGWRVYDVNLFKKLKLAWYYFKQFTANPSYLNSSFTDTVLSFYISYFMKHDFKWFYDYIPWDQKTIGDTLRTEYDWETASDTDNTWRIGDGTAAFYNYIYYTLAGFSEHDTFRSNQVREGMITREEALAMARQDNQPRFESIAEYAHVIGFDFDLALSVIDTAPKLY